MKSITFVSAVSALVLSAAAVSAQTAPATAPAAPAINLAAPATTGVPAALANDPIVVQIKSQLNAQGYTITSVVKSANGDYVVNAVSAAGVTRQITYTAATGAVVDTVANGAGAMASGMPGDDGNGNDDNGRDDNGSRDNDRNDNGSDRNGSDDNGSEGNDD